ncbi:MAG TPA: sodium:solute symporter family protein [Bacteroidales bacterium]|nr:sodium:solute symporter family protein [Bacteroidales bacterium]
MHWIDLTIFGSYMVVMLLVGLYFYRKNESSDDYYVGSRNMGSLHIGLSVVATDVGGGFSIGLGGLGFVMGLAGSWMLFAGLVGAWLAAVILVPRVHKLSGQHEFQTFPQLFGKFYSKEVAIIAAVISAIGYLGFTSSQILAGAKLASASFNGLERNEALLIMGAVAVIYTALGGLKAVIYTDTIQWIVLLGGLIFIGLPLSIHELGGWQAIRDTLPDSFFSLSNISWQNIVNWMITIIPIWFIGMTLYQRIYASKSIKSAKRAWFIAGLFEYPIMAFVGVLFGLFARAGFEHGIFNQYEVMKSNIDPEIGLPLLLRHIMPVGLMGLMMSAYFSAIMSTADSCIMAASGNVLTDLLGWHTRENTVSLSRIVTVVVGALSMLIAMKMPNVLELMLYSYAFMVSGLFVPMMGLLFMKKISNGAALLSMIIGGFTTISLIISNLELPFHLDPNIFGISLSIISYFLFSAMLETKVNEMRKKI